MTTYNDVDNGKSLTLDNDKFKHTWRAPIRISLSIKLEKNKFFNIPVSAEVYSNSFLSCYSNDNNDDSDIVIAMLNDDNDYP